MKKTKVEISYYDRKTNQYTSQTLDEAIKRLVNEACEYACEGLSDDIITWEMLWVKLGKDIIQLKKEHKELEERLNHVKELKWTPKNK